MAVTVVGNDYDNEGDGMAGVLAATFKAHADNGAVLLNLNDAKAARDAGEKGPKKNDPRPAYVHRPFPAHVHHPDGRVKVVANANEKKEALGAGFRVEPYPVVRVAPLDPGAEQAAKIAQDAETAGKIASQNDLLRKALDRIAQLEKDAKK